LYIGLVRFKYNNFSTKNETPSQPDTIQLSIYI
jgi:hypothetical protein